MNLDCACHDLWIKVSVEHKSHLSHGKRAESPSRNSICKLSNNIVSVILELKRTPQTPTLQNVLPTTDQLQKQQNYSPPLQCTPPTQSSLPKEQPRSSNTPSGIANSSSNHHQELVYQTMVVTTT
ncbi:hypothetical protein M758_9G026800 [Ceratodon purpureus]|nr:hypothetical protein M758_9G026800 [Ceratodon purpureus]